MVHSARRDRLRRRLATDLDGLLVTDLVNVRYLTGFTGSNGALLVTTQGADVLATDGRYTTQAGSETDVEVMTARSLTAALVERGRASGVGRLGFERHRLTVAAYDALVEASDGIDLLGTADHVEALRVEKDEQELRAIEAACRATSETFTSVLGRLRPGRTERDVEWDIRSALHERGAELAFDSIVAFGPNSAEPHHAPTDRPLATGDLVKLDFGGKVDGYHADMTRTVVIGPAAGWQREVHAAVMEIQADLRAAAVPGALPVELDTAAAERIKAAGYAVAHGLGHGVGLQIHESPFLVPGSTAARLADSVPVTIEPGVYLPGRGGVRIEDTVVVRPGGAEPLTTAPRELIEI